MSGAQLWPVVDVWLNPDMTDDLAAVAVGGGESTVTRQWEGLNSITALVLYSHQNNAQYFDEIRVGTAPGDVMIPEPGSMELIGLGAVALILRRRR